jgi:hypothetical protein
VRQVVAETGIVRVRRKRAVDSTILADAVATPDTITQLIAAIRRVGRLVPGAAEAITVVCTGHDYRRPGKPVIEWDEPGAQDTLVSALVNDATALLAVFAGVDPGGGGERARRGRWRCWRWSPGGMSSPRRARMAPMGGGGSPAGSPPTG